MKITNAERFAKVKAGIKEIVTSTLNMPHNQGSDKFCLILQKLSNGTLSTWLDEKLKEMGTARFNVYMGKVSIIETAQEIWRIQNENVLAVNVMIDMMREYGYDLAVDNFHALQEIREEQLITQFPDRFRGKIIGTESVTMSEGKCVGIIETLTSAQERKYYSAHNVNVSFDRKEYAVLYAMFGPDFFLAAKSMYITKQLMDQKKANNESLHSK